LAVARSFHAVLTSIDPVFAPGVALRCGGGGYSGVRCLAEGPRHRPLHHPVGPKSLRPPEGGEPSVLVIRRSGSDIRGTLVEVVHVFRMNLDLHRDLVAVHDDIRGAIDSVGAERLLPVFGDRIFTASWISRH